MNIAQAKREMQQIGLVLTHDQGEYRVNFKGGGEASAYYTTDLDDAVATGLDMARREHKKNPRSRRAAPVKKSRRVGGGAYAIHFRGDAGERLGTGIYGSRDSAQRAAARFMETGEMRDAYGMVARTHYRYLGASKNPAKRTAAQIIRKHYGLKRPVTAAEVAAEIKNLKRRRDQSLGWDDMQHRLAAALNIGATPFQNPIKGPGKFEGETYAVRYAYENPDEDLGDSETFNWYGRFSGKIKGRGPFYIIVEENSQGFVSGEFFDTEAQLNNAWRQLERGWAKWSEGEQ